MIVTSQKPVNEILSFISGSTNILVAGCDGCTQPPRGIKEAEDLSKLLELAGKPAGERFSFQTITVAKQCDTCLAEEALKPYIEEIDAVLSLACGIGVQTLSELFPGLPVYPAQDTHFMGAEDREAGSLMEMCSGCGECRLGITGGICPVTRCTKGLLNGACGGTKKGKCEMSPERDCGWVLIYEQLKKLGKLEYLRGYQPPRDFEKIGWRILT